MMPDPTEWGLQRFYRNLAEPNTAANQLLQGKAELGFSAAARFVINRTVGLLGFFDVGADMGLPIQNEDFGQTFGLWGVPTGPYIVFRSEAQR